MLWSCWWVASEISCCHSCRHTKGQSLLPACPSVGLAIGTTDILLCEFIYSPSQGRNHFRVVLVSDQGYLLGVMELRCFGGAPLCVGWVGWIIREHCGGPLGASKGDEKFQNWPCKISAVQNGEGQEKWCSPTCFSPEKSAHGCAEFCIPPAHILRLVNKFLSYTPQVLFKVLLLGCVLSQVIQCTGVKPHWILRFWELRRFKAECYRDLSSLQEPKAQGSQCGV